ncbi:hypothetical protein SAMN05661096_00974 [Marivirga sericea]|uniref:DUF748 domain-containing protein n=1 Tax=Marivirga sericea TaxID=1028 RepID=A0A1X7IRA4_9BACT|nr:hypothetical protein [Marivirga sericea]SMG17587.1 hypothetical protein SAMN05661096_00974 [Marivirga sericea]
MNRKQKKLYRSIGFAILILFLGFIVNDQLRKLGNRISGEYLQELISTESKGLYQLNFDDIDLNILRQSLNLKNISLSATPANREDSINAKNLYEARVGEVNISLESVLRIYTQKELVVDGIEVIDPLLFMTKINPEKKPLKFGRETGELYDVISEYLDLLQINYLKVRSGTVEHSPSNFRLKAIDFSVENFQVSQERNRKKIFYSEAINLGVNQQSILLPDSIHELSFEGFELSTKDSILNFNNFKINPRKDIDPGVVFQQEKQNVYDIDIPTLELKGINYLKAYEDNFLVVKEVNIPKPQIKIQSVLKSKKQNTEQAENSIGASLLALFDLIEVDKLKIKEGGLNLTLKGDNQQRFLSDNISIDLFNIQLDSTQRDIQNIIHYFEHATVEINDYDYLLPDNLHNIKFKKLNFNTIDSTLLVQNLEIKPSRSLEDSTMTQFNLSLPVMRIDGIAHRDIYDNERVNLKSLALRNSVITITPPYLKNSENQKAMITPERLSDILVKYLSEVKLKKFSVLNTDLNVGNTLKGKSLNIESHLLKLDSGLHSWHMIADSTLINGQELVFKMNSGDFSVSSFQSQNNLHSLDLTDVNFTYKEQRDRLTVEYLNVKGVQLDSILNRKKINIDSLTLFKPKLNLSYKEFSQPSKEKREWTFSEKPINILLKEGDLSYQIDEFRNLSIADFDVELNYDNQVKFFQVTANKLSLTDDKLKHQIRLARLSLPKNQSNLSLKDLHINPYHQNDSFSISIKVPEISFTNFNQNELLQNQRFEADSMLTRITQLNYRGSNNLKKYFKSSNEKNNKLNLAIKNSKINLLGSSILLIDNSKEVSQLLTSDAQLTVRNLTFPKNENSNFGFADDFTIKNKTMAFYSPSKDTISLKNLTLNSFRKTGEIEEFLFTGAKNNTSLAFGDIKLMNLNFDDYINRQRINVHEISSAKTSINLQINGENSSISRGIPMPFKSIKIQQLHSENINIELYHQEKKRSYFIRKADLSVNRLALDSILNPKKIHHQLNSVVFTGKNYRENFGKNYTVTAEDYTFRYPEAAFSANAIKLRSQYDRFEYSKHINYQNDWFKLDVSTLKAKNLNIDSLLNSQKFILNKLEVQDGDFTVFRDLNVPHNDNRIVPMPQKLLSELEFAFQVDTVFVNSDIHIHIIPKETSGIGTMTLNIDEGHIFNLRTHHFKNENPLVLQAKGQLNEKADFSTKVEFPIPSEKSEFRFMGTVGALDLRALNEMLIPLGAIEIRSGANEEVNINFQGNEDYAEGLMEFRYNNLKINLLDRETYQSKGFGNNLKTIFANSFVVSSKNPRWFSLQEGNIFFERIKSRSIFNLWAKALLSGAVSSIGINKSKEEAKAYYKENKEEVMENEN